MVAPQDVDARPRLSLSKVLLSAASVVVAGRLLFFRTPVGGDEAGFLMAGSDWHRGSSLYGDYWVDRPPLLMWIMELTGNVTALRIVGCLATIAMVIGVAWAARIAAGPAAAQWSTSAGALFGIAHWFGQSRVNGEMLAAPFVAWSFAFTLYAVIGNRRVAASATAAGALAACSVLIKQSVIDGAVFGVALAVMIAWLQPPSRGVALRVVAWGVAGALATTALILALAADRGTTPTDLVDALILFRVDASEVIRTAANGDTTKRLGILIATWAVSGLAAVSLLGGVQAIRRRDPVLVATVLTLAYASLAALLGGSYWAHYLIQLVPAAALAAGLLATQLKSRVLWGVAIATLAMTAGNLVWGVAHRDLPGAEAERLGSWLHAAAEPADTAVVAYGQPNVLWHADMSSPYPYLWSLPVRTRDSSLIELTSLMETDRRPTWIVEWSGFDSWGVDPSRLLPVLEANYRRVADLCGRAVWLAQDAQRTVAPIPRKCP